ncbi:hypothetical protein SLEP1_g52402 [Rubroshorea leprosula]|uniref:Uncharacterized protein n=1 Tax=Rubroshorea leprosula TaxID=152421 RepID=A0AAV5M9W1_9ROSI|nr:hypothetical protein SLEP1_g52402 [Rubroshorea leprosula]
MLGFDGTQARVLSNLGVGFLGTQHAWVQKLSISTSSCSATVFLPTQRSRGKGETVIVFTPSFAFASSSILSLFR